MEQRVQGIWYEKGRSRWRVKLVRNGELQHRSYHRSYKDALLAYKQAMKEIARRPLPKLDEASLTSVQKFLRQPPVGAGGVT